MEDWFITSGSSVLSVILSALFIYVVLIIYTRIAGLRSFSKMSSFDFAVTVAFGSILASTVVTQSPPAFQAAVALGTLYFIQYATSFLRSRFSWVSNLVDNEPLLLMDGKKVLEDNLKAARISKDELASKLREANVLSLDEVQAVVLEPTGDVSVLHSDGDNVDIDESIFKGVKRER